MNAFNTSPVGVYKYLKCAVCEFPVITEGCRPREREGSLPLAESNLAIVLYPDGDAIDAICVGCGSIGSCDDTSPFDARYQLMVKGGKVYAKVKYGRVDEVLTISAKIIRLTRPDILVTKNVLITRQTQ